MPRAILQAAKRIEELRQEFPHKVASEVRRVHNGDSPFETERVAPLHKGNLVYIKLRNDPRVRKLSYTEKDEEFELKTHPRLMPEKEGLFIDAGQVKALALKGYLIEFERLERYKREAGIIKHNGEEVGTVIAYAEENGKRGRLRYIRVKKAHFEPVVKAIFS